MTALIETRVDEAVYDLEMMRGALRCVALVNNQGCPEDYSGLCGQNDAMTCIVESQLEKLDRLISSLREVVPKKEVKS